MHCFWEPLVHTVFMYKVDSTSNNENYYTERQVHSHKEPHTRHTPPLRACMITRSSIRFCGRMHSNPNSTSFVTESPVFSRGGPAFTRSTCGHGGKQMWEHQKASLASQTFAAAGRGDPVRQPHCRPSVNHISAGFSGPSLLFHLHVTFPTLMCNFLFPFSKRSEVSEGDNWSCICFVSCLSTSQWIWNYCVSTFSKKLKLNIYFLLSNFVLVASFYAAPAWPFDLCACFMQLFHSQSINIAFFSSISTDMLVSVCVPLLLWLSPKSTSISLH